MEAEQSAGRNRGSEELQKNDVVSRCLLGSSAGAVSIEMREAFVQSATNAALEPLDASALHHTVVYSAPRYRLS